MKDISEGWMWLIALALLCLAGCVVCIWGDVVIADPSTECVKVGGQWVMHSSSYGHCERAGK